jgi:hypothetical protein
MQVQDQPELHSEKRLCLENSDTNKVNNTKAGMQGNGNILLQDTFITCDIL